MNQSNQDLKNIQESIDRIYKTIDSAITKNEKKSENLIQTIKELTEAIKSLKTSS